jgi:alpha-amylase
MADSLTLLFGVHNHQPVGNFADVFQRANHNCYRPFINTLYNFPRIKATLHFSGSLIDWLLDNEPQLLLKVKALIRRRQIELLTGGYYEPILPMIPEADRLAQIRMLSCFIRDYFEYEPKGAWIGERVWEPQLVTSLTQAKVQYILLDDFHFRFAGIKKEALGGYYISEEKGKALAIFPISTRLRYLIPFSRPEQAIAYLRSKAGEGSPALTIVDDGEKFGFWPGTHRLVYGQKWLERFFQLLLKNRDWLRMETFSEYMGRCQAQGRCHLPSASYEEMMSWSGGNFKNFFGKYPEANNLHKRMLYVSERLHRLKSANHQAKKFLYMGQCNCAYWHGVFGGLYLRHLRGATYRHLIKSQALLEKRLNPPRLKTEVLDFDQDGREELIVKNPFWNVFIAPGLGGGIFELDYIPKGVNLLDGMSRRPEDYHRSIQAPLHKRLRWRRKKVSSIHDLLESKERNLQNFLIYDAYRRIALLDHFLSPTATFGDFKAGRYKELGDFIAARYDASHRKEKGKAIIMLQRQGNINYDCRRLPLKIQKTLSLTDKDARMDIEYSLRNLSDTALNIVFGVEFNISAASPEAPNSLRCDKENEKSAFSLKDDLDLEGITGLALADRIAGLKTLLHFEQAANLWVYPLQTVSASEQGFERNYPKITVEVTG